MSHRSNPSRTGLAFETLEDRRHLSLTVKIDYTYDTSGFFATQARRDVLQAAVNSVAGRLNDSFSAVIPTAANGWDVSFDNPSGADAVTLKNPAVAANTMVLYVGAEAMGGNVLANATGAGYSTSSTDAAWLDTLRTRGRPLGDDGTLATPLIGRMSFNPNHDWYASTSAYGIGSSQNDLYSVAAHEFGHVLGVGASRAWANKITNHLFYGPASTAVYDAAVPTETYPGNDVHLESIVSVDGQAPLFQPYTYPGQRLQFTRLDQAVLKDLGYDITVSPKPQLYGSLTGYAIYDANNSRTKDTGEGGFGAVVYLDANFNGTLDNGEISTQTAADGKFTFTSVPTGRYRLGQYDPSGQYVLTTPTGVDQDARIDPNTKVGPVILFSRKGVDTAASISGRVFSDTNGNGIQDLSESAYTDPAVKPYLDLNGNGAPDAAEPTAVIDAGGVYTFGGLTPGTTYTVRLGGLTAASSVQTQPTAGGRTATAVAGQNLVFADFGVLKVALVHGHVYNDANGNKAADPGETPVAGRVVYADYNANDKRDANEPATTTDANGYYALALRPGTYRLRQVLPGTDSAGGYLTNDPNGSTFRLYGQVVVTAATPAYDYDLLSRPGGSVTVYAFDDTNGNGVRDAGEGLSTSAHFAYVDTTPDGVFNEGEPSGSTVGGITFRLNSGGAYGIHLVPKGDATVAQDTQYVTIYSGTQAVLYFAVKPAAVPPTPPVGTSTVRGYVVGDTNQNAKWDTGENGVAGRTVYLDLNNNGTLDAGDVSRVTDAKGYYAFKNLTAGTFSVREVLPSGSTQVSPKNGGALSIGVSAGQTRDAIFYVTAATTPVDPPTPAGTASVSGKLYPSGSTADKAAALKLGWRAFLDADNDGQLDAGETAVALDAAGQFSITGLKAGTYTLRLTPVAGWAVSAPAAKAFTFTLKDGQAKTGQNFTVVRA